MDQPNVHRNADGARAQGNAEPGVARADPVVAQAVQWADQGQAVALATVIRTWGSAPRRAGAHMAVTGSGEFAGSVSGGCIEGAVVQAAMQAIDSGAHRSLEFGVTNEMAWEVGLACGGKVQLLVERVSVGGAGEGRGVGVGDGGLVALLRRVVRAQRDGEDVVLATRLSDGVKRLVDARGRRFDGKRRRPQWSWPPIEGIAMPAQRLKGAVDLGVGVDMVERVARSGEPLTAETPDGPVFLRPYVRPPHLVIVGAVHIAQALAPMAAATGLRVTVVDPRRGFATDDRFPGTTVRWEWPDRAMARLDLDHRSAVAALTHDPKIDDPALIAALESDAFYVGALGGRATQATRRERLAEAGCSEAVLKRVRGPIGLPIGAATPEEIAVAVLAEVVAALRLTADISGAAHGPDEVSANVKSS